MLERFVMVQRRIDSRQTGAFEWRLVPTCERLRVWHIANTSPADDDPGEKTRHVHFHVDYRDNIERGMRVIFTGEAFEITRVTDSQRLRGLELTCVRVPPLN